MLPKVPPKHNRVSRSDFSTVEKEELQNVKQLCLAVVKGQKRLVREVVQVRDNVKNNSNAIAEAGEVAAQINLRKEPEVTIQHIHDLEEKQTKNLQTHLIALDMKEKGSRCAELLLFVDIVLIRAHSLFANRCSNFTSHEGLCQSHGRKVAAFLGSDEAGVHQ